MRVGQSQPSAFVLAGSNGESVASAQTTSSRWLLFLAASVPAAVALGAGWRGADYPAQFFRASLVRHYGLLLWNGQWYGGHATLDYGLLAPALGALVGPIAVAAVSGFVAAVCFDRLLYAHFGERARVGALWFAIGTVSNLIVGRTAFAVGIALGLGALLALQRHHGVVAVVIALLCPLASPLAAVSLGIALVAVIAASRPYRSAAVWMLVAAGAPLVFVTLFFPQSGRFPFEPWQLFWDLGVCAIVWLAGRAHPVIRIGTITYAVVVVAAFLIPSSLGENISRLGQFTAGPLLACLLWANRRMLLAAVAIPLLVWQWVPTADGITRASSDPSTSASYYQALDTFFGNGVSGRVEIPFTYHHWETYFVAEHVPLARGWERQVDIAANPIFYGGLLTAQTYRAWLDDNGVQYVALADAQLDDSSKAEAALITSNLPYLREVFSGPHWRVWKVNDYRGLVAGPATLVSLKPDSFTLDVTGTTPITIKVHSSSHWSVAGSGCAGESSAKWTVIEGAPLGRVEVSQALIGTPCPTPSSS